MFGRLVVSVPLGKCYKCGILSPIPDYWIGMCILTRPPTPRWFACSLNFETHFLKYIFDFDQPMEFTFKIYKLTIWENLQEKVKWRSLVNILSEKVYGHVISEAQGMSKNIKVKVIIGKINGEIKPFTIDRSILCYK